MNRLGVFQICLLGWFSFVLLGCQSMGGVKDWLARNEPEEPKETPEKLVAVWSNSVLGEVGQKPQRGLGGRVYFYNDSHQSVEVDGHLVVYVYDDSLPDTMQQRKASRKYEFNAEQVASSLSPSELGPSYSFWIPWDDVGGERARLSVIPVFMDAKGKMIVGDQARHVLPGRSPTELASHQQRASHATRQVSTAAFNQVPGAKSQVAPVSAERADKEPNISSSTILLPPSMKQRLSKRPPKGERRPLTKRSVDFPKPVFERPETSAPVDSSEEAIQTDSERQAHSSLHQRPARTSPFARQDRDHAVKLPGLSVSPLSPVR